MVYGDKTKPFWLQSIWVMIGYLLLALEEQGLASLTYTPPANKEFNELFNVPQNYILQTILPVGKKGCEQKKQERLGLNDVVYCEAWKGKC